MFTKTNFRRCDIVRSRLQHERRSTERRGQRSHEHWANKTHVGDDFKGTRPWSRTGVQQTIHHSTSLSLMRQWQRRHFNEWRWIASHFASRGRPFTSQHTVLQNRWATIDIDHGLLSALLIANDRKKMEMKRKRSKPFEEMKIWSANTCGFRRLMLRICGGWT